MVDDGEARLAALAIAILLELPGLRRRHDVLERALTAAAIGPVLFDRGVICTPEPFQKLVNQGMILGEVEITAFQREDGSFVVIASVAMRQWVRSTSQNSI